MSLYRRWSFINFHTFSKNSWNRQSTNEKKSDFRMTPHAEIRFSHDPPWRNHFTCGGFTIFLEKTWKKWKQQWFHDFFAGCAYIDTNRNTISKWAVGFRYGNFFIPRVEKNLKISLWEKKHCLPRAYGPWEPKLFARGLIFEVFSTLGMKKFPYLKLGPFGNPILSYKNS